MIQLPSTACPDWAQRLINRQSIIPAPIYPASADHALTIFKQLRITDLIGKPTFGEASDQWVFDFVSAIFGAYDQQTGDQLIRESLLLVAKKNSKSSLSAGIMLTALILCWREDEEHLIIAPTKEVADNSFKPAASMVRADDELSAMFHVQDHLRSISHRITRNSLKVVAAETDTVSGKKAGRILIDELHIFGERPNADSVLMEATGGMASRPEGFVIYLSTQSDKPPAGVFKQKLNYFRNVRDGIIDDPKALPVLYEYPAEFIKEKKYLEPDQFYIPNPNLGRSVSKEWLVDNLRKALAADIQTLQKFASKHLNVEIGMALRDDLWAGAEFWADSVIPLTLAELIDRSEVVCVGIDGGGLDDLLGLYVIGRDKDSGIWLGWGYGWAHKIALERRKEIAPVLRDFENAGCMSIIDQPGPDVEELADIVDQVESAGLLYQVGCDPQGIGGILEALESRGIDREKIVAVSQGWRLGSAIKTLERKLAEGVFSPADQPLMSWCVGNSKIEPRANGILITKTASGRAKIDPVIAMMNATHLMMNNPEPMNVGIVMAVATRGR